MPSKLSVLGLSLYGSNAASHRVRLSQFIPGLAAAGIDLHIQSLLSNAYLQRSFSGSTVSISQVISDYFRRVYCLLQADRFDLAIVHCELFPFLPGWFERLLLKIPYIYDFDDAFFLKYSSGRFHLFQPFLGAKANLLMASASAVTAGNNWLACHARKFNSNVFLLPSVVDTDSFELPVSPRPTSLNNRFTVGWIGSPSTAPYLQLLVEPLMRLATQRPVRLIVVGASAPNIDGVDVCVQPWSLNHEISIIHQFDVGVMPLPSSPWSLGKCGYKLIQCMAAGIPVVASRIGANLDIVPPQCGFLADTPEDWLSSLIFLATHVEFRKRMGSVARLWVQQHFSIHSALPILIGTIHRAVSLQPI
jgi:glycosyltransferase involved in cell wall biosynthesis